MKRYTITTEKLQLFSLHLQAEERTPGTMEKYLRDVRALAAWLNGEEVSHDRAAAWRESLLEQG